jgi:hypothetical protein
LLEGPLSQIITNPSKIINRIIGQSEFFVCDLNSGKQTQAKEYDRMAKFASAPDCTEILMRLELPKHQTDDIDVREEERDLAAFDCFSLYKHSDQSFEWRLCKIMQREPIVVQEIGSSPTELIT